MAGTPVHGAVADPLFAGRFLDAVVGAGDLAVVALGLVAGDLLRALAGLAVLARIRVVAGAFADFADGHALAVTDVAQLVLVRGLPCVGGLLLREAVAYGLHVLPGNVYGV